MKQIVKKIIYLPLFIILTPFMGIVGFFGYIYSLWQGYWKCNVK